jgi:polysaccharide pyruvyl transferase CsaB
MKTRRVLIAGGYGTGNLGDEAILAGFLRSAIDNRYWDRDHIVVFSKDPDETRSLHKITARRKNSARALIDFLVSNDVIIGGGELFQDLGHMAIKYSILGFISKLFGKRVVFYAVGVSSSQNPIAGLAMQIGLSTADEVCVRDFESKKRLSNLGISKAIRVVPDPATYVEPVSTEEAYRLLKVEGIDADQKEILMGIVSQYIHDPKQNEQVRKFFLDFLKTCLEKHDKVQAIFIPFNRHKGIALDQDLIFGKWLERNLKSRKFRVIQKTYTPQQVMGIIGLLDIVVSTRFHPLVFAAKANVKAIGVDVFEKVASFCREHEMPAIRTHEQSRMSDLIDAIVRARALRLQCTR